jgi:hypothetical protein
MGTARPSPSATARAATHLTTADVPRIVGALESLRFASSLTMLALDDGPVRETDLGQ